MEYINLIHDCIKPSTSHIPDPDRARTRMVAYWSCPECKTTWGFKRDHPYNQRYWHRVSGPSNKWKRQETKRLKALE